MSIYLNEKEITKEEAFRIINKFMNDGVNIGNLSMTTTKDINREEQKEAIKRLYELKAIHNSQSTKLYNLIKDVIKNMENGCWTFCGEGITHTIIDFADEDNPKIDSVPVHRVLKKLVYDYKNDILIALCEDGTSTIHFGVNDIGYLADDVYDDARYELYNE